MCIGGGVGKGVCNGGGGRMSKGITDVVLEGEELEGGLTSWTILCFSIKTLLIEGG